jgi:predicted TIM-barrel fold metal-dependent hydrolase
MGRGASNREREVSRRQILSGISSAVAASALRGVARGQPPAAASGAAGAGPAPVKYGGNIVVDVHCHTFNSTDLPITGFATHFVPGLSDLSRELTSWPEMIFRKVLEAAERLITFSAPSADHDVADMTRRLQHKSPVPAVAPFTAANHALDTLADEIAALLHEDATTVRKDIEEIVQLLWVVRHGRAEVASSLMATYPTVRLFTPCLVDFDAWSGESAHVPLAAQVRLHELVAHLSMAGLLAQPEARLHPFMAFDPLREVNVKKPMVEPYRAYGALAPAFADHKPFSYACIAPGAASQLPPTLSNDAGALEMVRYAIERSGFVGVKLYPPVGFLPAGNGPWRGDATGKALDRALRALYAYCQAEEVPITTHTSPANGFALGYGPLSEPNGWRPVLEDFPYLRLNLGHFGHGEGADGVAGVQACNAWIRQAALLIQDYPNVYADMSNSPLVYDPAYRQRFLGWLDTLKGKYDKLPKRIMYGSDWWLNRFGPDWTKFVTAFTAAFEQHDGWIATDILGGNALRFLGFIGDDGAFLPKNRNRVRLAAFYKSAGVPSPAWLG